jgi:hypothetical protein
MQRLGGVNVYAARLATCIDGCDKDIARPRSVSATGARGGEITEDALWPPDGAAKPGYYFLSQAGTKAGKEDGSAPRRLALWVVLSR